MYFPSPDNSEFFWVAHPNVRKSFSDNYIFHSLDEIRSVINEQEKEINFLIDNRKRIEVIGGWANDSYDYSYEEYDDFAIARLDEEYYLLNTISSSFLCNETETWYIYYSFLSYSKLKEFLSFTFHTDNYAHIMKALEKEQENNFQMLEEAV